MSVKSSEQVTNLVFLRKYQFLMSLKKTAKDWMLPISMTVGAAIYLIYHFSPILHPAGPALERTVRLVQPLIIFAMLFLTFCRIEPKDLKPHRWHWWLLLIQGGSFTLLGLAILAIKRFLPGEESCIVLIESAMLCLICPTATAAAVVTKKLGGDVAGITTYTILINLLTAAVVPAVVPLIQPLAGVDFITAFSMILAKVFPLLILPCFCAWLIRYLLPRLHRKLAKNADFAFYIWAVGLCLAIVVTTKSIVHSTLGAGLLLSIAGVSLICCVLQFWLGHVSGCIYDRMRRGESMLKSREITCGQSLGQKNTVFAIWMGYTFLTPETSIAGGLYSIWHNLYNSWQIYREENRDTKQ